MISFLWLSVSAQSYYYYKGQRIYLIENPLIRYVELQQTLSSTEAEEFRNMLSNYCWRTDEYSSYFNKYYIKPDKYEEFMQICFSNETIISLHAPNYAQNDTSSFYPTRIILVKNKTNINLQAILTDYDIPFSNIVLRENNTRPKMLLTGTTTITA